MGELFRLDEEWDANYTQRLLEENEHCSNLYESINSSLNAIQENIYSIRELNKYERLFFQPQYKERYKEFWDFFFRGVNPRFENTIIDSSKSSHKSFFRLKQLHTIDSVEISLIHLIKKPDHILQKSINRNAKRHQKFGYFKKLYVINKTAFSWFIANLVCIYKPACPYSIVSFEDLCEFPEKSLRAIGEKHGIDVKDAIRRIETKSTIPSTCAISGNMKVRKNEGLYFDPSRSNTVAISFTVKIYSFFLNFFYRYLTK